MKLDKNYFPGWVRKAITFTNDDGNIPMDRKFIDILKPYGIRGTFNLCSQRPEMSLSDYRDFYEGYGIANHCKLHPFAFDDGVEYKIAEEPFNPETANIEYIYPTEEEGVYMVAKTPTAWRKIATSEKYISLVKEAEDFIYSAFGRTSKSFVWPFCEQNNKKVFDYLASHYRSVRKTGVMKDSEGFALPKDRLHWSYNAWHRDLLETAELFESWADDGELKLFCFGLHSVDYQTEDKWDVLKQFAEKYGDRPEEFYYDTVDGIFDYEDALAQLQVRDGEVENSSDITLYVKIDGEPVVLAPHSVYRV